MKQTIGVGVVLLAFVTGVIGLGQVGRGNAAAAQARQTQQREVPKFEVDPSWPHIPNGWTLGQVSSAASDPDGNIWIFHRPRTVKPGVKTGPPVMEFDQAGNYIQGWGGQSGKAIRGPRPSTELPWTTKGMSGSAAMGTTIRS